MNRVHSLIQSCKSLKETVGKFANTAGHAVPLIALLGSFYHYCADVDMGKAVYWLMFSFVAGLAKEY
jgi:hypothetical protein